MLSSWEEDAAILHGDGYAVEVIRALPSFVEARVRRGLDAVIIQWAVDSAFRFFPLVEGPGGLPALHPFDLATNKALALIGRLEVRDWVDLFGSHDRIQPLGYLCWAACGKDPGSNPRMIVSEAARSGRNTQPELDTLSFEGVPPDAAKFSHRWKAMLAEAREVIDILPADRAGTCVLDARGELLRGSPAQARDSLPGGICFHRGCIRGALPRVAR